MTAPTVRQLAMLEFLWSFIVGNGMPPTIREICAHFGFKSTNAAIDTLKSMEKKGLVRHIHQAARSWRPAEPVAVP